MFFSILFPSEAQASKPRCSSAPECFSDLKLDQVIKPIIESHSLDSYYYTPLDDLETIAYRQESMRELEDNNKRWWIRTFADEILLLESEINALNWRRSFLDRGRLLDLCESYISALGTLSRFVEKVQFSSEGLSRFASFLDDYCTGSEFLSLCAAVSKTRESFASLKYCLILDKDSIGVKNYEQEADLSMKVQILFRKFQQGKSEGYRKQISEDPCSETAESEILEALSKDFPEAFSNLDCFCKRYSEFIDPLLLEFSEEVQFPISWLDLTDNLRENGLGFCYPSLGCQPHSIQAMGFFDIALALKPKTRIVTNNLLLTDPERIMVITGPNQGGKTTFARAFGQIHYLASLGICIPGSQASLVIADHVLTHFGREEDISELCGNLQDDLVRLHDLLEKATSRSIIIISEIFASTTLDDAQDLGLKMMEAIIRCGAHAAIVTFLDKIATCSDSVASMMSTVAADQPEKRTFKIVRKPPDGIDYAISLAKRHGLDYQQIRRRLGL